MRKIHIITILLAACALLSCKEMQQDPTPGKGLGEIYVTAAPGDRSVLVKLDGLWRVRPQESWLHTDVDGREGEGAFTFRFDSNESDFVNFKPVRKGAIVIQSLTTMVADTLWVRQQGIPDGKEYESVIRDSYIEFPADPMETVTVLYANVKGAQDDEAVADWALATGADIACVVTDFGPYVGVIDRTHEPATAELAPATGTLTNPRAVFARARGLNLAVADFGETPEAEDSYYNAVQTLLSQSYDNPDAEENWLVGGSFYYLSMMEAGYSSTPAWYPANPAAADFAADRYVQGSNLTDCVWMTRRDYTPTWTADGKSWRADYVYASHSVWNATTQVSVLENVPAGVSHKAILLKIKF